MSTSKDDLAVAISSSEATDSAASSIVLEVNPSFDRHEYVEVEISSRSSSPPPIPIARPRAKPRTLSRQHSPSKELDRLTRQLRSFRRSAHREKTKLTLSAQRLRGDKAVADLRRCWLEVHGKKQAQRIRKLEAWNAQLGEQVDGQRALLQAHRAKVEALLREKRTWLQSHTCTAQEAGGADVAIVEGKVGIAWAKARLNAALAFSSK